VGGAKTPLSVAWRGRFGNRGLSLEEICVLSFLIDYNTYMAQMIGFVAKAKRKEKILSQTLKKRCIIPSLA
jgi:hypothetical protein